MIEISCATVLQNMHDFLAIMQDHSQANRHFGNPAIKFKVGNLGVFIGIPDLCIYDQWFTPYLRLFHLCDDSQSYGLIKLGSAEGKWMTIYRWLSELCMYCRRQY